ncbi:MAG: TetR/AcrR family transcriptional regulator [Puia sp.]|nr:TetR/AcrR family transcriptional regulator [Puia sp.]
MKDSREHILLTSLTLFLQKGFKEVTMKEIVDKTGLSKGAFYHYFSSKEQVFSEVIRHFFMDMMMTDFTRLSQQSLKAFYGDLLENIEKNRLASEKLLSAVGTGGAFNNNHYYLIFDAMRILPDFKERLLQQQNDELKAWKKRIALARKNKEIRTQMSDEQVARLFIYSGDGFGINSILSDYPEKMQKGLGILWDGLYQSLNR